MTTICTRGIPAATRSLATRAAWAWESKSLLIVGMVTQGFWLFGRRVGDERYGNQVVAFNSALAVLHDGRDLLERLHFALGNLGRLHLGLEVGDAHPQGMGSCSLRVQ